MNAPERQTDLLGKKLKSPRPKYEASIERHDKTEAPDRAARIRWLNTVMPEGTAFGMPFESYLVFSEAKDAFIYGHFVATIVLASSFVEHWLGSLVAAHGAKSAQRKGLASIIEFCRQNEILPNVLCDRADDLRKIRNPFVHLKSFDHPQTIVQRSFESGASPNTQLQSDAEASLITMYSVARYAIRGI